jgi:hypothetical protein
VPYPPLSPIPVHVEPSLSRRGSGSTSKYVEHLPEANEEEHERRTAEAKVSKWLAGGTPNLNIPPEALLDVLSASPTTSSSLDHSSSAFGSGSASRSTGAASRRANSKKFGFGDDIDEEGGEFGVGVDMAAWRGTMREDGLSDDGEADEVLPEVERMALEAEERRDLEIGVLPARTEPKKTNRRLSLFGRKKVDREGTVAVSYHSPHNCATH